MLKLIGIVAVTIMVLAGVLYYIQLYYPAPSSVRPTQTNQSNIPAIDSSDEASIQIFSDNIRKELANNVIERLNQLAKDPNVSEIKVYIYSDGGWIKDAMAICDAIKNCPKPVSTISIGNASSAATLILSSGAKGKRLAAAHNLIMLHRISIGGNWDAYSDDLEREADILHKWDDTVFQLLAENTGQSIEKIKKDLEHDFWLSPQEAIEYGLVDRIWRGE